jgi:AcrR family transcriptional regulator
MYTHGPSSWNIPVKRAPSLVVSADPELACGAVTTRPPPKLPGSRKAQRGASALQGRSPRRAEAPAVLGAGDFLGGFFSQNRILAGAASAFLEKGIEGATVEDILVAAGVSRRTFYKVFQNKEDVLVALHRGLSELFLQAIHAAVASTRAGSERMVRCVDVFLLAAQRSSGLMLQLQAEAQRRERLSARRKAMFLELVELIQAGFRQEGRPEPDALLLFGVLAGLEAIVRSQVESGRVSDEDMAKARAAMLALLRGALA